MRGVLPVQFVDAAFFIFSGARERDLPFNILKNKKSLFVAHLENEVLMDLERLVNHLQKKSKRGKEKLTILFFLKIAPYRPMFDVRILAITH